MNSKTIAGLGMLLLAAGLLTIYFLDFDMGGSSGQSDSPDKLPTSLTPANGPENAGPRDVENFLEGYNATYKSLKTDAEVARWKFSINQTASLNISRINAQNKLHDYTGSRGVIDKLKQFRGRLDLNRLQDRQIERAWQLAAQYPATSAGDVFSLMDVETALTDSLAHVSFPMAFANGQNQPRNLSDLSTQLGAAITQADRLALWNAAQKLGPKMKDNLVRTRDLRNSLAQSMGNASYFALAAARYGMQSDEFLQLLDHLTQGVAPLYQQLHCFYKNTRATTYGSETPRLIPAHWLSSLDGKSWPLPGITDQVPARMDSLFHAVQPQWILEQAEKFHTSLGFAPLPLIFWGSSSPYPYPAGSDETKSLSAGAWHLDLDQDVRALMNIKSDFTSFGAAHNILAQTYYQLAVSRDEIPATLRTGANPAFVPALGLLMQLASNSYPSLMDAGIMSPDNTPDTIESLLSQAMISSVIKIPLLCGTQAHWEFDFYENDLPRHLLNTRWWEYSVRFQGIEPATQRGEMECAPAIRSDIVDRPLQGIDEALGIMIAHQLHRYICKTILNEDVRLANYRGRTDVGRYLQSVMQLGATRDWAQVMREATGEELSSDALVEYYQPLMDWLSEQNTGREIDFSLPEATSGAISN